ncbi:hypothetical protein CASFOL_017797 [Castilleja foliolosa]|uniref:Uncharacterized protein n=1 Tax=Castilleja foliolosa TaxID=1961234 RepID=A0ABD3DBT0_9LAMI
MISQSTGSVPTKKKISVKIRGKSWLPIEFDAIGNSWLPIDKNQKYYVRTIGNKVRELVISCYKNWASVPEDQQKRVFRRVEIFDLRGTLTDDEYKKVLKSYDHTAASRYSSYKNDAHKHYKAQQENPSRNKAFLDSPEDWKKCYKCGIERVLKGSKSFVIYDMPESSPEAPQGSVSDISILMKELERMSKIIAQRKAKVGMED